MNGAYDTALHVVIARTPKTIRCVDLFQIRTRIFANSNQSFYFHYSISVEILIYFRIPLQKHTQNLFSLPSNNELHCECSFYSSFFFFACKCSENQY